MLHTILMDTYSNNVGFDPGISFSCLKGHARTRLEQNRSQIINSVYNAASTFMAIYDNLVI